LRDALVDRIVGKHNQELEERVPDVVIAAMRAVPRHLFTPGVSLAGAYEDTAVITKTTADGVNVSSVSAPWLIASMLTQLDVRPGQSVLEIGSGGYNAALLRELVGPGGSVASLDIDPEVIGRARACLDRAGYGDVRTICADGEQGAAGCGPFDRIIVTVQAWDIPPAWVEQLAPGGRLVVPLLIRGLSRSWALEREGGHLVSRGSIGCGFVPMQGAGARSHWSVPVGETGVTLRGDEPADVDGKALAEALAAGHCEVWTGVTATMGELISDQLLSLVTVPHVCRLSASREAVDRGLVAPYGTSGSLALASGGSLAYRTKMRPAGSDRTVWEFGVYGHGPQGPELAGRLADQIRTWDREHRGGPGPVLRVHPAGTPVGQMPGECLIRKRHTAIVLSWPTTAAR
jgi:protein-L-isoaspartate(D-aspartate) O-methyltransferase